MTEDKKKRKSMDIRSTVMKTYGDLRKKIDLTKLPEAKDKVLKLLKGEKGGLLSLDIGTRITKIALFSLTGGKPTLLKYEIKELKDEDREITAFISNFIKSNSIEEKNIIINMEDPESLIIKRISLPNLPEKEMGDAIGWEIKDDIPFDMKEAELDWQVIGESTDKDGAKKIDLMLACGKRDLVDRHVKIAKGAGLSVVDIKSAPFSSSYIVEGSESSKEGIVSVLDIGAMDSTFSFYRDGKLSFIRELPFGSEQFTSSISGVLLSDKGRIELTREKAEEIKREFGIPKDPNQALRDGITASQIMPLIRPSLERLIQEIRRSIDYFTSSFDADAPKILYLSGGGSRLKGLDTYLKDELKFKVDRLPVADLVEMGEGLDKKSLDEAMVQLAGSIGATLGRNKRPHLLPREYRTEKIEAIEKVSLRVAGITLGVILLLSIIGVKFQERDYKNRLANARLHLETIDQINRIKDRIVKRTELVEEIRSGYVLPDWILKEVGHLIPGSAVINKFELDQGGNSLALKGYIVAREHMAQEEITSFIKNLERSPFFKEASLESSDKARYEGKDALQFTLRCILIK